MSVRIDEHTDHMKYTDDMEAIDSDIMDQVIAEMNAFDPDQYTEADVRAALNADTCSVENFKALLSPAAMPFLEEIARKAQMETRKHFGNSVMIFTIASMFSSLRSLPCVNARMTSCRSLPALSPKN